MYVPSCDDHVTTLPIRTRVQIAPSFMKSLIDKIKEESSHLQREENAEILKHFQNTLDHIRYVQGSGAEQDYKGIVV